MRLASVRDVTLPTRRALRQLCDRLVEVRSPRAADLDHPTVFTRLNEHCRPAERLARMVFRDLSLLDRSGTAGAAVFLVDMNRVFESFIETRLRSNLAGRLTVTGQWRDRLDTAGDVPIVYREDTLEPGKSSIIRRDDDLTDPDSNTRITYTRAEDPPVFGDDGSGANGN